MTDAEIASLEALLNKARALRDRCWAAQNAHKMLGEGKPFWVTVGEEFPVQLLLDEDEEKAVRMQIQLAVHRQWQRYRCKLEAMEASA